MNPISTKPPLKKSVTDSPANWIDLVRQHVASLQFGTVEIVVHDSRVVQIEKTERVRLGHGEAGTSAKGATHATPNLPTVAESGGGAINAGV